MSRDFLVSWETLHRDARALAWRLLETGRWERIVAVTRGGLVPATIVARELGVRLIDTVCIRSYDHRDQGSITVLKGAAAHQGDTLVVDDLADTGATLRVVRQLLPEATIATVYVKPAGRDVVDVHVTEVGQETWIHFPWDLDLRYAPPAHQGRDGD
ncbi:MAG: xanthine phosphoribosyltransferase [Planctomycetota bacterium]